MSHLRLGQANDEARQSLRDLDLTPEAAGGQALRGGGLQHFIFHRRDRWQFVDKGFVDIAMAGGAHGRAATFADYAVNAVARRRLHEADTGGNLHALRCAGGADESDLSPRGRFRKRVRPG